VAIVSAGDLTRWIERDPAPLVDAATRGAWHGRANRLSAGHVDWPIVDEIAAATRYPGMGDRGSGIGNRRLEMGPHPHSHLRTVAPSDAPSHLRTLALSHQSARAIVLRRRSALAFDGRGVLRRETFLSMLRRLRPPAPPWDAIDWSPHVHLVLFVHRVQGLVPGLYAFLRDAAVLAEWRAAMRPDFLWERVNENDPNAPNDPNEGLFLLVPIDCRGIANRVSCDQGIAGDGFFSLGMIARVEGPLAEHGDWFYRRLFWECGMVGQVLYLEAEAAGARATGIGCFYDDPVHEMLGLTGHAWQSLYHFSMGLPVEDTRLTTEPGYPWES
jgi:hypothetical protein